MFKFNNLSLIGLVFLSSFSFSSAQKTESHVIYNAKLKKSNFKKLVKEARKADVIFFGEIHNDPIAHWLQLKLVKAIDKEHKLVVGMEMFERDQQESLDRYMKDEIDYATLKEEIKVWNNYKTDYAPIVDYAKANDIPVVACNVPRPYASQVYQQGFEYLETLDDSEKMFVAPLPVPYDPNLPGYLNMLDMFEGHGGENFPKAQAIKDATMAYSISETVEDNAKYIHLNGKYHSDNKEGIVWYLNEYKPSLKVMTISTIRKNEEELSKGLADFIIVVDEDMTNTY